MSEFKIGDLVVLTAGSMRMVVEATSKEKVSTVWCNEGVIGRDSFSPALLKRWEHREEEKSKSLRSVGSRGPDKKNPRDTGRNENIRGKTGWDGKSREKKFFRKD